MQKKSFLVTAALLVASLNSYTAIAQHTHQACRHTITHITDGQKPREHELDITKMTVQVKFEPQKGKVIGKVTHYYKPLRPAVDSVFFDAPAIKILSATLDKKDVKFKTNTDGVTIYPQPPLAWGSTGEITFEYEATPRKGIYFIGWNDKNNKSRKQIWTQGQGIDNRYWIPMYDDANDKMITETIVEFDKKYEVLSNGTLLSKKENGNTTTWHYTMTHPHGNYLLMLGIGEYAIEKRKTKSGVPVNLYYYPDQPEKIKPTYVYSTECIDFMEEETGIPYPWESYSQIPVQDFMYGAMENTTATIFGDFYYVNERGFLDRFYYNTNVHELVHQWFGDLITHRHASDIWLHESYATYYPKLFNKKTFGQDYYEWQLRSEQNASLEAAKKDNIPIRNINASPARWYPKGSAVIDMMNYVFGEDQYKAVIHYYLKKHAYANVETNDLFQAFQDTLGITPDWFFDQWIYRGGEPHYEVNYKDVIEKNTQQRNTIVKVQQIHEIDALIGYFKMPVVIEVHYKDGSKDSVKVWVEKAAHTITIPNSANKDIAFVLFDPSSRILKNITFHKSYEELMAQATKAPHMIDRYDAVVALRTFPIDKKRNFLIERFNQEQFHAIRSEVVEQLIGDDNPDSYQILDKAANDPAVEVRRTLISKTVTIPKKALSSYEKLLKDASYNNITMALDKLLYQFPENKSKYLKITEKEIGMQANINIKWHQYNAIYNNSAASKNALVEYASNSYEFITRRTAFDALIAINHLNEKAVAYLFDAALSPNTRLATPAVDALTHFAKQTQYAQLIDNYYHKNKWEDWQKALLAPVVKKK
jgi:aminopeptidase N